MEHNAKLKAQAHDAITTKGYQILNEINLKLYQEREAIKSRAVTDLPTAPQLNTRKLLDAQGQPAGLLFPTGSANALAKYKIALRKSAELGMANPVAANKIFEILRTPLKKWRQFWKWGEIDANPPAPAHRPG